MILDGELYKLGGGPISHLQERYFTLSDKTLLRWYADKGDAPLKEKGVVDVRGAKVIDRGTYMSKKCFSIEGENLAKGTKEYFLFCESKEVKWKWLSAIMSATGRYNFIEDGDEFNAVRLSSSPVAHLIKISGNSVCADCDTKHPTWSVGDPFGVFVCIDCIGVHRGMWANRCKEIQLDAWLDDAKEFFAAHGNAHQNSLLEYCVPSDVLKPCSGSAPDVREKYIHMKYAMKFAASDVNTVALAPRSDATAHSSVTAFGAPPRYIGVLFARLQSVQNETISHAMAAFANGFQEVVTREEGKKVGKDTVWKENLQLGIDHIGRPLYVTIYSGGKIYGTCEIILQPLQGEEEKEYDVPVTGKGVGPTAVLKIFITFTKMT